MATPSRTHLLFHRIFWKYIHRFTASVNTVYLLQLTVELTNKQIARSDVIQITMVSSPLHSYIAGGNRMQSFS
jgi:hypothetical protein